MLTLSIWRIRSSRTAQLLLTQMSKEVRGEQCQRASWGCRNKQMAAFVGVTTEMPIGEAGGRNCIQIAGIARG